MATNTKKYGIVALLGVLIIGVLLISGCIGGGPSEEKTPTDSVNNYGINDEGIKKVMQRNESHECIDFENDTSLVNWYIFDVDNKMIFQEGGSYGNVVRFTDGSGLSIAVNDVDFGGNWLELADDGCLCFDYKVDWNSQYGFNGGSVPKIGIYSGTTLNTGSPAADLVNRLRAGFVGNPNNPNISDNVWDHFCLPISVCMNGSLPSNSYGTWSVANAGSNTLLTGAAACTAWNTLISNVHGLYLVIDYNANPSEFVYFDNFCWKCDNETECVPVEICPEGCTCLSPEDACNESLCDNRTILCRDQNNELGFCYKTPNNTLIKYCGCLINLQHQDPNLKIVGAPIWITLQEGCNTSNENKTFVLDNTLKASNSADYTMNAINCYKPVAIPPGSGGPGTLYWTMWQYMTIGWPSGTSNPPTPNDKKWCVEILVDPNSTMDPPYGEVKNWTIRPERECLNGTCCELSGECGCIVNYQININNPNFMNIKFQPNCNESIQNLSLSTTLVASNACNYSSDPQNCYAPSGSPWGLSTYIDYNPYGTNNMPTITDPNRHWCVKIWRDTNNPNNVIKWEMYPQEEIISGVKKCTCEEVCPDGCACLTAENATANGYTTRCNNQSCGANKWCWNKTIVVHPCPTGCYCYQNPPSGYSDCHRQCMVGGVQGKCYSPPQPQNCIGKNCICYNTPPSGYTSCNQNCTLESSGAIGTCWKPCPSGCTCMKIGAGDPCGPAIQPCSMPNGGDGRCSRNISSNCPGGCACLPRQSQSNYSFCNNKVIPCNLSNGPGLCFNTSCPIGCKCYTHEEAIKLPNYTSCNKSCLLSNGMTGECWKPKPPCHCGEWNNVTVKWWGSTSSTPTGNWTGTCGGLVTVKHNRTGHGLGVLFGQSMNCVDCPSSQPTYYWNITGPGGFSFSGGGHYITPQASFTPPSVGTYQMMLTAECNGIICQPCRLNPADSRLTVTIVLT
ncbi:MAG: hypothetical protein BWK75_06270 [Candidatus Altiarchaeales archaeon A3]|nr:MAG: hypothetical protein BWK75_06270 [Candidatus Altiarchaeales archaeon A3]